LPLLPLLVAGCRLASIPLFFRLPPRPDSILDCVFLLSCVGASNSATHGTAKINTGDFISCSAELPPATEGDGAFPSFQFSHLRLTSGF
jgi:hypothetical protein